MERRRARAPRPQARAAGGGPLLILAALVFCAVSLWPWRSLLDAPAVAEFLACAAALTLALWLLGRLLRRLRPGAPRWLRAALVLLAFAGAWRWNQAPPPDVVLVVLDSLRAQNVSSWGYERPTTPQLDDFAARHGVRLTRFFAQAAETDKAVPAILAGIQPSSFHDAARDGADFSLPPDLPLLGEALGALGYRSYGLSTNPKIRAELGYDRGFDRFDEFWDDAPRPAAVFARLADELAYARAQHDAPFFHFALVLDPHMPYEPAPEYRFGEVANSRELTKAWAEGRMEVAELQTAAVEVYDGEIRETDAALGEYLRALEAGDALAHTLVVITADHGEKFFEHDEFGHGGSLYEEVIHIPAVVHLPSPLRVPDLSTSAGVYDGLASQVDLLPTLLAAVGGRASGAALAGRDLRPELLGAREPSQRPVLVEQLEPERSFRALRGLHHKLEVFERAGGPPAVRVTDLAAGHAEPSAWTRLEALPEASRDALDDLHRRLREARRHHLPRPERGVTDAELLRKLAELGYTQG